ncbi:MAG: GntR family transcriptional regulator [Lentisphaeria bacterium]|nr:GntR family transcriptional regulator [Lentisphaeria bacterium]MBQ7397184.1 GntR family transcriptional regulator [Lentisphaeria bacterium]
MRDKSKFRMIADQFRYMIRSGELVSGEKFHTRKELCSLYNISLMTAFHVQEELQKDGLIANVPGVGFFVNSPEVFKTSQATKPIKRVRMIGSPQAIGKEAEFGSAIVRGAQEECKLYDIEFDLELVQVLNNPARIINTSRKLASDEALLIMLHSELLPEVVNLLLAPEVRAVTTYRSFPGKASVLPDLRYAARQTVDFLKRRGVKKFLYAGLCSRWQFPQHETEFYENICEAAKEFTFEADFSGNFRELEKHAAEFAPDAIVFSQSDAAVHFADNHLVNYSKRPIITGYGHAVLQGKEKTLDAVYYPDAFGMGKKAVRLLLTPDMGNRIPLWERVGGKLIEFN